ncbi:class I SAM-dependent methyltransferase [Photobacterium sp. 1_MG-2023]|uniref:class I SAM-dependent DNA methyltransferase n=1 Tax=Photobacterium sp. 1_MG-2023 TaxID=3062646 RepID=UPI0026E1F561|nr:class I SAM-dependent methyltransferase [Photobacterium sp. 1_MG-2023]MDO6706898.1 class I SAM-dependent methyltransferase [Photobacterium sp. 1_MG-2023]
MDNREELWRRYYERALGRNHNQLAERAFEINQSGVEIVVDCGCGTGSDIQFFSNLGYRVHGFDINADAIALCRQRFSENSQVELMQSSFEHFDYPAAGIVYASNSLYFSLPDVFQDTWAHMTDCLVSRGVFAGDFMGVEDDWATGHHQVINAFTRDEIQALFHDFEIIELSERNEMGSTVLGKQKRWHTYSVLAVKKENRTHPFIF